MKTLKNIFMFVVLVTVDNSPALQALICTDLLAHLKPKQNKIPQETQQDVTLITKICF